MDQQKSQEPQYDYSKIYSPSKIDMFDKCPKQYYFSYIDPIYSKVKNKFKNLPENIWWFNTVGKAVHNAITLFYYLNPDERNEKNSFVKLSTKNWVDLDNKLVVLEPLVI